MTSLAFHPNGEMLASGSRDTVVCLWDVKDRKLQGQLTGSLDTVQALAFSSDGKILASGTIGKDSSVRLWNVKEKRLIKRIATQSTGVTALTFHPQNNTLAAGSKDGKLHIIKLKANKEHSEIILPSFAGGITSLWFVPNGQALICGNSNGTVHIWDMLTNNLYMIIRGHSIPARIALHPNGKQLVSAIDYSYKGGVRFWNINTPRMAAIVQKHKREVNSIVFSPNGKLLASGSNDKMIYLWNAHSKKLEMTLPKIYLFAKSTSKKVTCVAFHPNGKLLASGHHYDKYSKNNIRLWDIATGNCLRKLKSHSGHVDSLLFSPNGEILVAGERINKTIWLWSLQEKRLFRFLKPPHTSKIGAGTFPLAFTHDSKFLASSDQGQLRIWEVNTGRIYTTFDKGAWCLAFSPDANNDTLAIGTYLNQIILWDWRRNKVKKTITMMRGRIHCLAFSPDGKTLASGGEDTKVLLWHIATGRMRDILTGHSQRVTSLAYSPDGHTLVSASDDTTIRFWNVRESKKFSALSAKKIQREMQQVIPQKVRANFVSESQ